jgi:hypothetical protein
MQIPLQITFLQTNPSAVLEADIREKVDTLARLCDRIVGCHVFVEAPPRHHRKGGLFRVRIELDVPGAHLVVGHSSDQDATHEDVYVAVRDAFRALRRLFEDHLERQRGEVKSHSA